MQQVQTHRKLMRQIYPQITGASCCYVMVYRESWGFFSVPVTPDRERATARLQEHSYNSDKKAELWLWANGTMDYHTWVNSRSARSGLYKHPLNRTSASWFLTQYQRYSKIKSDVKRRNPGEKSIWEMISWNTFIFTSTSVNVLYLRNTC